jgi:hypothetical protein
MNFQWDQRAEEGVGQHQKLQGTDMSRSAKLGLDKTHKVGNISKGRVGKERSELCTKNSKRTLQLIL